MFLDQDLSAWNENKILFCLNPDWYKLSTSPQTHHSQETRSIIFSIQYSLQVFEKKGLQGLSNVCQCSHFRILEGVAKENNMNFFFFSVILHLITYYVCDSLNRIYLELSQTLEISLILTYLCKIHNVYSYKLPPTHHCTVLDRKDA